MQHELTNLALGADLEHLREAFIKGDKPKRFKAGGVSIKMIANHPCVEAFSRKYNRQAESVGKVIADMWKEQR